MTDSVDGLGSSDDLSRLFSPDGTLDADAARALAEQLSVDHRNGHVEDPGTVVPGDWVAPGQSGFVGLAPVAPEEAFPGISMSSLKTGLSQPELAGALGELAADMPSESGMPASPGDPSYYFAPGPPAHTQEVTSKPAPIDHPEGASSVPGSMELGLPGSAEIEGALGQLAGEMPTESGAPTHPGDPGYYFLASPPGRTQEVTSMPVPMQPPEPVTTMPDRAESVPSGGEALAPMGPEATFSGISPSSLTAGLGRPELEAALGQLTGYAPSETGVPTQPGDPGYYFVPSPPAPSQELTSKPATEEHADPVTVPASVDVFDVDVIRRDFPILEQRVHGERLVWLDNAATTQKPQAMIDRLAKYYETENSNVHRGAHTLAALATEGYEGGREAVRRFLGASSSSEIVFVRGTTEAINLVAQTYGRAELRPGDEILLTTLEHHSNIVPWQLIAAETGARLRVVPISDSGEILLEDYGRLLGPRTKLVGISQVSNALGTILPVREMTDMAHRVNARVVVDGAQAVAHFPVDVQALDADFYAFSGHKLFGPTGVGALYGKQELLDAMPPWQGGGSMIEDVTFERTTYAEVPQKFEAGTPIIAGAIGLGAAIDYLERLGMENVSRYEHMLTAYATDALNAVPGLVQIGTAREKVGVFSFIMKGIPTEQLGRHLDQYGIAVRSGHHCAQPTLRRFGLEATVRASLALYNTVAEVDLLVEALERARTALR